MVEDLETDFNDGQLDTSSFTQAMNNFLTGGSEAAGRALGADSPAAELNDAIGEGDATPKPLTAIGITGPTNIAVDSTEALKLTLTPVNTTQPLVNWSSSNEAIARVDKRGRVTGISNGSVTIKAQSRANASISQEHIITVGEVVVDNTPPQSQAQPAGGFFDSAQAISLSSDESATIYYTIDGSSPTTDSAVYSQPLAVSATTPLNFFAVDNAGNAETVHTEYYLFNNTPTAPDLAMASDTGHSNSDNITNLTTLNFTVVAALGADVSLFSSDFSLRADVQADNATGVWSATLNNVPEGTHTLSVLSQVGGNTYISPVTVTVQVDTTPPATSEASPMGGSYNTIQQVSLSNPDNHTLYYTLDGSNPDASTSLYTAPISTADNATTTLKFLAIDTAGNTEASINTETYLIDSQPATTTASPEGGLYTESQTITLSVNEAADIYYTLDGTEPDQNSTVYSTPIAISETTTLKYFAQDTLGNNETIQIQTYTIDQQAPLVTLVNNTLPSSGNATLKSNETGTAYLVHSDITVATLNDITSAADNQWNSIPVTVVGNYVSLPVSGLISGTYQAYAIDEAGNLSDASANSVQIDSAPPVTTATPPGGNYHGQGTQNIVLATNKAALIYYTLDGSTPEQIPAHRYTNLIPITENSTLKYFAVDVYGQVENIKTEVYEFDEQVADDETKPVFDVHQNLVLIEGQSIHASADATGFTPPDLKTLAEDETTADENLQFRIANFTDIPEGFGITIGMDNDSGNYANTAGRAERQDETLHVHPSIGFTGTITIILQAQDEAGNESDPVSLTLTIEASEEDSDGDGISNRGELAEGSDPLNGTDVLVAASGVPSGCCLFATCFDMVPVTGQLVGSGNGYSLVNGVDDGMGTSVIDTGKGFVTLNTITGAYSFTPTGEACTSAAAGRLCTVSFQYTVGGGDPQTMLIVIDRPLDIETQPITVVLGGAFTDESVVSDPDGEPLNFSLLAQPELDALVFDADTGFDYSVPLIVDGAGDAYIDDYFNIGITSPSNNEEIITVSVMYSSGPDTDNDSMPDVIEDYYGFNKNDPADAAGDADSDGLTNALEVNLIMDPTVYGHELGGDSEDERYIYHVLNRLSYGVNDNLLQQVADAGGIEGWIESQLTYTQTSLDDGNSTQLLRDNYLLTSTDRIEALPAVRPVHSQYQLQTVMGHFWDNHFSTYALSHSQGQWELWEEDQFYLNALGNFRTLLGISAKGATMSAYLNGDANIKGAPNENYAREVMELHTLGVDGGYSAGDIAQLARIFTGWNHSDQGLFSRYNYSDGINPIIEQFTFNSEDHDDGTEDFNGDNQPDGDKPFLINVPDTPDFDLDGLPGGVITSRTGVEGVQEGEQALDILAVHPTTARFICTKLAQKLVSDTPQAATLDECQSVFLVNKDAADQIAQVVRGLVNSAEFRDGLTQRNKLKDPQESLLSLARLIEYPALKYSGGYSLNINNIGFRLDSVGQSFFFKPEPTGWPELFSAWNTTDTALKRLQVSNDLLHGLSADSLEERFLEKKMVTPRALVEWLLPKVTGGYYRPQDISQAYDILRPNHEPFVFDYSETKLRELLGTFAAQAEFQAQ